MKPEKEAEHVKGERGFKSALFEEGPVLPVSYHPSPPVFKLTP